MGTAATTDTATGPGTDTIAGRKPRQAGKELRRVAGDRKHDGQIAVIKNGLGRRTVSCSRRLIPVVRHAVWQTAVIGTGDPWSILTGGRYGLAVANARRGYQILEIRRALFSLVHGHKKRS